MSHTPGPWRVLRTDHKYVTSNDGIVALVPIEANTKLVAAAPALLEALEDIIRCESYSYGDSPTWDRACDVIKKVRGKA